MEQIKQLFSNFIPIDFFKKFSIKSFLTLEGATITYLVLPYIIFFLGWLNIFIAIPVCALLIFTLLSYGLDIKDDSLEKLKEKWNSWNLQTKVIKSNWLLIIIVMVLAWVLVSGSGGFFHQNDDYAKHNSILRALVESPFPAHYNLETFFDNAYKHHDFADSLSTIENDNPAFTIIFYVAYYLPSAVMGKLFGWGAATFTLFLWTFIAVFLAVMWFLRFIKHFSPLAVLLFILFSGMDFIGTIFLSNDALSGTLHMEWYAGIDLFQFSSNTASLYWVPQHILVSWLTTSLILQNGEVKKNTKHIGFIAALAIFWSPFVFIGLLPYALFCVIKNDKKEIFTIHNIVTAPILAGIVTLFIMSNPSDIPKSFLWEAVNLHNRWLNIFMFLLLEFGIYTILAWRKKKDPWTILALVCLLLIPAYKMGAFNDFAMRVSLPSLFLILIHIGKYLFDKEEGVMGKKVLLIMLMIGAISPMAEISRSIQGGVNSPREINHAEFISAIRLSYQYIGTKDTFFFNALSSYTPNPVEEEKYQPLFPGTSFVNAKIKADSGVAGNIYILLRSVGAAETKTDQDLYLVIQDRFTNDRLFTRKLEFKTPYSQWETGNYSVAGVHYNTQSGGFIVKLQVMKNGAIEKEIPLDDYFKD